MRVAIIALLALALVAGIAPAASAGCSSDSAPLPDPLPKIGCATLGIGCGSTVPDTEHRQRRHPHRRDGVAEDCRIGKSRRPVRLRPRGTRGHGKPDRVAGSRGTTMLAALIGVGALGAGWAWRSLVL